MRLAGLAALLTATGLCACATDRGPPPHAVAASGLKPCVQRPLAGDDEPVIPDLGCANQANLRAMIADPRDLATGRPLSPAQGDAAFAAAARNRTGQDKALGGDGSQAAPALVIHDTGGH
jgi:hypothetical protein